VFFIKKKKKKALLGDGIWQKVDVNLWFAGPSQIAIEIIMSSN